MHDWQPVDNVNLKAGVLGLAFTVELQSELFDVLRIKSNIFLYYVDVEVRSEIVHVCCH